MFSEESLSKQIDPQTLKEWDTTKLTDLWVDRNEKTSRLKEKDVKEYSDEHLEKAAKEYCERTGLDPDESVYDPTDDTMAATYIPQWRRVVMDLQASLEERRHERIKKYILDKIEEGSNCL